MFYSTKFITASKDYGTHENMVAAPYIRKSFVIGKMPTFASVSICGLGFYRMFLNGTEITRGRLATYQANPDDLLYYDEYEITSELLYGENVFGFILGNGFLNNIGGQVWDLDKASFRSAPKMAMAFCIDGKVIFEADTTFKTHESPIIFDDVREGEHYDARKEIENWATASVTDYKWQNAIEASLAQGMPTVTIAPPITVINEYTAISITPYNGGYIYEFPYNSAGVCRLELNGKRGQEIKMLHFETLDDDGKPYKANMLFEGRTREGYCQQNIYICKGGQEKYEPSFTYHGFKYVFVEGVTSEQATDKLLTYLEMHAKVERVGDFSCSDKTINSLCEMISRSDLSNLYHFPTDCPQREKNGWTADASLSAQQMLLNFDVNLLLEEWLKNIRAGQKQNGALPGIIPTTGWGFSWGNGPAWDSALFYLPYYMFRYCGNTQAIVDNLTAMKKYLSYLNQKKNVDGLFAFGLGDWCQSGIYDPNLFETPLEISDSLVCVDICEKVAEMFGVIGLHADAKNATKQAKEIIQNFKKKWMNEDCSEIKCDTQTAQVLALKHDLFDEKYRKNAVIELVNRIEKFGNHFNVGVIGGYSLFNVLSENGYSELAYNLITQVSPPSYGYLVEQKETTLWEMFYDFGETNNRVTQKNGLPIFSKNHHFWGFIYTWFSEIIAGLKINPNFNDPNYAEINPHFLSKIDSAETYYNMPVGKIEVKWNKVDGKIALTVVVPVGAEAKLIINGQEKKIKAGKHNFSI